ncbi:MAG: hypothetical protein HOO06_01825 [Bdellovibrionaceae bacterium]|nr:hypothetical protein [Pseudobdellovibrionaceae bacterium]
MMKIKLLFLLSAFLLVTGLQVNFVYARRPARKIDIKVPLKTELNNLLKATDALHTACYKQNEPHIEAQLKNVLHKITVAHQKSFVQKDQAMHLSKMLDAAKTQIQLAQMNLGEKRQANLKAAFRQLVQISKVYKLDPYRIFFCSKDKSVWLQKGWRAKNPISPQDHKNCGKLVK